MRKSKPVFAVVTLVFIISACASVPVPFQLVGPDGQIHGGVFRSEGSVIEATIAGKQFRGLYVEAAASMTSRSAFPRRGFWGDTYSTLVSNSVRAHLASEDGEHLNCAFFHEGARAVGECQSTSGAIYQLVASGAR